MESKVIRPQAQAIQDRFFEAVNALIGSGRLPSLSAFCEAYGLHRPKYSNLRTYSSDRSKPGTGYKFIDIDAPSYLVNDFGVSGDWILTGRGGMFREIKNPATSIRDRGNEIKPMAI